MLGRFLSVLFVSICVPASICPASAAVTLYGIEENTRDLVRIDPATGARTTIGATGVTTGSFGDLAYDAANGVAYWAPGRDNNNLYTVDLATGAASLIGEHGLRDVFGLAYDTTSKTLFATSTRRGRVNTLNVATAAPSLLGGAWFVPAGLDYNAADGLVGIAEDGGQLYRLSTTDGGGTLFASGDGGLTGGDIAYDVAAKAYYVADGSGALFRYDAAFASRTLLAEGNPLAGLIAVATSNPTAAAAVNGVPEPATWAMLLLGFGAIGLTLRRRHRPAGAHRPDANPIAND